MLLVLEQEAKEYGLMVVMGRIRALGPLIARSLNVLGISSEDGLSFYGTSDCEVEFFIIFCGTETHYL